MEIIDLYDEFDKNRDSITYHFMVKALSVIDPEFLIGMSEIQVDLKINGKSVPLFKILQEYEKVYDECVAEEAQNLLDKKINRVARIISNSIKGKMNNN